MSAKLPEIELPKSLEVQWHDKIALLRIVRPEKRNALNDPTVLGIDTFFSNIPEHVRAVIIEAGARISLPAWTFRRLESAVRSMGYAFYDVARCDRQNRVRACSRCRILRRGAVLLSDVRTIPAFLPIKKPKCGLNGPAIRQTEAGKSGNPK
jgi:hypothetical protein